MSKFAWEKRYLDFGDVTIEPLIQSSGGFGRAAYVADCLLTGGERYRVFTDAEGLAALVTATEINADVKHAIETAFAQVPRPREFMIIKYLSGSSEDAVDGLDAVVAANVPFFFFSIDTRTESTQQDAQDWAATNKKQFGAMVIASGWLTGTKPAGYSDWASSIAGGGVYHPTTSQHADVAWMARMSAINPDLLCPSFRGPLYNVTAYGPTDAQSVFAIANHINILGPLEDGGSSVSLGEGVAWSGEAMYAYLSLRWFVARSRDLILQDFAGFEARSAKPPLNARGAAMAKARVVQVAERGMDRPDGTGPGHFTRGNPDTFPLGYAFDVVISPQDFRVTVTGRIQMLDGIRNVAFSIAIGRGV